MRQYLEVTMVVLWSVFLLWYGLFNSIASANESKATTRQATATLEKLNNKLDAIAKAKELQEKYSELALLSEDSLPSSPKIVTFVNSIALLVNNSNLVLTKLDYQGVKSDGEKSGAVKMGFGLEAKGEYSDIERFVSSLERLPRIVHVVSVSMSPVRTVATETGTEQEATNSNQLSVNISAEFFYRNE